MRGPVAWIGGIGLGAVAGASSSFGQVATVLGLAATVAVVAGRGWPFRASLGGILIGAGIGIAVVQAAAFAACGPDEAMAACFDRTGASFRTAREGAASIILGLTTSAVALHIRGGPPSSARVRGALLGLAISAVPASLEGMFQPPAGGRFDALGIAFLTGSGAPTLSAAILAGWLLGPTASLRKTRLEWAWIAIGMAMLAVIIGAVAVGLGMGLERSISGAYDGADSVWLWLPYGLGLALFGILFAGPFAFPIALGASTIWTAVMARHADG